MANSNGNGEAEELAVQDFAKLLRSALILTRGKTYQRRFLNTVMESYRRILMAIVESNGQQ